MKKKVLLFVILLSGVLLQAQQSGMKWQKLFNGTDLSGWNVPDDNLWWTVHDGILRGSSDPGLKGSILWTKKKFGNFIIRLDFKFGDGVVDSGVFLRTINEQIQLGISGKYKRDMTCSPYIGSKGDYPVEAKGVKDLLKSRDWNSLEVRADGNVYTVWLNGKQVLKYESDTAIESGPVGLQVHPNKSMEIEFRNIYLAELK